MLAADRAGWAVSVLSTAMFLGWEGSRQEWSPTLTLSPSHAIPARFSPSLAAHSPQSPAQHTQDVPLSRGWCSVFPSGMGLGGEANPATRPELPSCLPVCLLERGDREESGHYHVPSHTCPLLLTNILLPGDRAKPTLLQKGWSGSCPPCCIHLL